MPSHATFMHSIKTANMLSEPKVERTPPHDGTRCFWNLGYPGKFGQISAISTKLPLLVKYVYKCKVLNVLNTHCVLAQRWQNTPRPQGVRVTDLVVTVTADKDNTGDVIKSLTPAVKQLPQEAGKKADQDTGGILGTGNLVNHGSEAWSCMVGSGRAPGGAGGQDQILKGSAAHGNEFGLSPS